MHYKYLLLNAIIIVSQTSLLALSGLLHKNISNYYMQKLVLIYGHLHFPLFIFVLLPNVVSISILDMHSNS